MRKDVEKLLTRGVVEVIKRDHLERALVGKKKLRIKFGADPTAPDLHLGHAVVFKKLREFQEWGHQVVFIIGDYTAKIGDPSGRSRTRPMLTDSEIKNNAKTYFKQVGKIVDLEKTEIRWNSEWFSKEEFAAAIILESRFTVQRMLERDDFDKRIKSGEEVYVHELLYPMMQAYDSVQIKADIEIGGTDQKFNMLAGRDLQRRLGIPEQDVITVPLLVGTDGEKKMSKSVGNYIGITEAPDIMFGKVMSIKDELIDQYYELCTDSRRNIEDPREAKLALAEEIVKIYHGKTVAKKSLEEFIRVVSKKQAPTKVVSYKLSISSLPLIDLLLETKMAESKSESRRLIQQGGVRIDGEKQTDPNKNINLSDTILLQVGKRRYLRVSGS